ncbi:TonB-dependent receptor [Granulicella tundricola]|uniref:TonB-dependent receptor n=1 Tax=Granulicella tundricola (strain ATCC BAA-1859 / DSM 23138 / MP5ACTX9) TaxID=1198114 RepID=E8X027_GRATM|nr:TonB-dependent receptor [Granulicella tundricola]ADW68923.1 hypothetical protein AciX9_1877 [Granulicella tundricola MP5ACTX9]
MENHLEKAIGAQRIPLQRTQGSQNESGVAVLGLVAALCFLAQPSRAAYASSAEEGGAALTGVVRDAQGVAQMGALVQVVAANATTIATAFTDQQGRYSIAGLLPGKYQVRASAALLVPATRGNLQLQMGSRSVVDLTLAALFDTASWLPASRRRADEPQDSWKWTLRSTANRPILRFDDDGSLIVVGAPESRAAARVEARGAVTGEAGEFGQDSVRSELELHEAFANGAVGMVRTSVGSSPNSMAGAGGAPSMEIDAEYERAAGYGGRSRTAVSYGSYANLVGPDGTAGLQVLKLQSGQQMALGEDVELEVGGSVEGVRGGGSYALATHPFVRLTAHPGGSWRLQYRMATDRATQEFADISARRQEAPAALAQNGQMLLEQGRHQEISASRKAGRAVVEVAYYHDAMVNTEVAGGFEQGISSSAAGPSDAEANPLLVDQASGGFRTLGSGYTSNGARFTVSVPLAPDFWVAAEYATGDALASEAGDATSVAEAVSGLKARSSQAAAVSVKGKLARSGTSIRASYRWQPDGTVTAVDPYGAMSDQAYLSCVVRQHLRWKDHLPQGLDATIDVTNLLAQGYRPFISADGHTLYFAQAPRTIQAGLSFNF